MTHCTTLLQKKCTVLASDKHAVHTGPRTHLFVKIVQECGDAKVDGSRWVFGSVVAHLATLAS